MGEHADYNGGFAIAGAADKSAVLALAPRADGMARIHSIDFDATCEAPLQGPAPGGQEWANPPLGVAAQIRRVRRLPGFDMVYGSDLPKGAGMSCGAAIACGTAFGLNHLFDLDLGFDEMLDAAIAAEHECVGAGCGVMDQFANLRARERCLLALDCRSREFQYVPLPDGGPCLVLCDSQVRRSLPCGEYSARRAQCEAGLSAVSRAEPGVAQLRDVTPDMLRAHRDAMGQEAYDRCLFVLQENDRAVATAEALALKDYAAVGRLLYESHEGLRDFFGASCPELDALVEGACGIAGVHGARLMGAGFGGCTINLVEAGRLPQFMEEMAGVFRDSLKKPPKMHRVALGKRTHVAGLVSG
jgi:galactokinase